MTPTTGNTSWRRDDQGDDAMWDASGGGSYFPVSTDASHSARFHSYEASSGSEGDMDIHLDLSGAGMKNISFDIINEDGDDYMNVQLSEDGGATFSTLGTYYTYASWTPITLTTTSVAANAVLRFAAIGDFGGSDIGLDSLSVSIAPSCAGSPTAGTVLATQTSGCTAYPSTVSASTPLLLTGITYQWQSSPDGTTYTDVSGATNTSYTASVSGNIYYRFYVTCTLSGLSDTSSAMELIEEPEVTVAASLPYFQGFEDWMGGCSGYDRPDISWLLNPVTGNASWRRDDQGADAAWTYADYGGYTPVSIEGSHSARFHTYEVASGETGSMDLHVNLSMPGTKNISFYYNNSDGDDSMYVMLSEDGGTTFNVLQGYGTTTDWERDTLSTSSVAANAVIRFYAISDYGYTDIGIDSLYISAPPAAPCATPTGLAATAITSTSAALSWSSVSGASGYEYVVDNTASTPSGAGTSTSATSADATSLTCATVYYLHVLTDCAADSSGWATISFTTDTCSTLNTGIINDADLSVLAYPNPAKNLLTVEIKGATGTNQHVQVTDVTGKVLMEETPANNKLTIDMGQFASGMYFVIYSDDANKRTIKVNKQ